MRINIGSIEDGSTLYYEMIYRGIDKGVEVKCANAGLEGLFSFNSDHLLKSSNEKIALCKLHLLLNSINKKFKLFNRSYYRNRSNSILMVIDSYNNYDYQVIFEDKQLEELIKNNKVIFRGK